VAVGASVPLPRAAVVRELDGACVLLGLIDSLAAHYARREVRRAARETLIRESFEEAGIRLRAENLTLAHVLHKRKKNQQRITLYFKASEWEGKLKARETHKFKKAEWFDLEELPANMTDTVQHVLDEYRRGSTYSEITE